MGVLRMPRAPCMRMRMDGVELVLTSRHPAVSSHIPHLIAANCHMHHCMVVVNGYGTV